MFSLQLEFEKYKAIPRDFTSDLPFPYWVCQPYVRPKPAETEAEAVERREKREAAKRPLEMINGEEDISKNKIKKLQRNPNKNFSSKDKVVYIKCYQCGNPKVHNHYILLVNCIRCKNQVKLYQKIFLTFVKDVFLH